MLLKLVVNTGESSVARKYYCVGEMPVFKIILLERANATFTCTKHCHADSYAAVSKPRKYCGTQHFLRTSKAGVRRK